MSEEPGHSDPGSDRSAVPDRPATYREVFGVGEFRAVFAGGALSSIGDYLGKVALAALMYQATGSVLASAASLAVTYLPWLTGAPFLVALAERYPYRRVMLVCDVARMLLVALAALPWLPVPLLPVLMFLAAMLSPPFESSRSALLPMILSGDRYVLGLAVNGITAQATQVGGFVFGGAIAAVDPRLALAVDAGTFALSSVLIWLLVRARPAVPRTGARGKLLKETAEGFSVVFGNRVLRSIAVVILSAVGFAILPEGLSAGWAHELRGGTVTQGLIMAAEPVGAVIGGIIIGRLVVPRVRRRLIRPLAMLVPLSLVGALAGPPLPVVLALAVLTGFAMSVILPANGLFVQALPDGYRARAFGVMQGGLQLVQGAVIIVGGAVAGVFGVSRTVGLWSLLGLAVMAVVTLFWPTSAEFDAAIARAKERNAAAEPVAATAPDDPGGPRTPDEAGEARTRDTNSRWRRRVHRPTGDVPRTAGADRH
ncbi:MFS transporter [Actinocatenispora rupis]|uniref:MFS transporter n=1 Tax=Actinocatenispora rupis TaxID=519421 RepID=A0A8J3J2K1_9ACTN|nr:MFS transporter [Actinocatenispora rupis]GID13410.1 MFS transporter [Actinocatenispora rupis]